MLKIALRAPPVEGKANKELLSLLASAMGLPRAKVQLKAGASARRKRVLLEGVTAEEVLQRLA